jgi:hypothetical protein
MMGGSTKTSTSRTAPSNPKVTATMNKLLGGINKEFDAGYGVYGKSLYPGVGGTTRSAWAQGAGDANSLIRSGGFNPQQTGAMRTLGGVGAGYGRLGANGGFNAQQSGAMRNLGGLRGQYAKMADAYDQDAPGYQRLRQGLMDDAITNVGAGFTSSGRFGGGSYIDKATESAVDAIAPLDYQNFQNDINNRYRSIDSQQGIFNSLFGMGQQGVDNRFNALAGQGATAGTMFGMGQQGIQNRQGALGQLGVIGAAQDADALANRQAEHDKFRRMNDGGRRLLGELSSILAGNAQVGGQTTTNTQPATPWWQQVLGYAAGNAGKAMSVYGGG